MKYKEQQEAIELRTKGYSIGAIAKQLRVSRSSASTWVRHVVLSEQALKTLSSNSHNLVTVEKRRQTRLLNEKAKRSKIMKLAGDEIGEMPVETLKIIGAMLYWAEGGKTQRLVRFSNGDERIIRIMMRFYRESCKVPEDKFRGYIHIHEALDHELALKYWSEITGIKQDNFFKTYRKKNKSSKNYKNTLPMGVMDIYVMDVNVFLSTFGWIDSIVDKLE